MPINTTNSTASTTHLNKTYYDRNLLENAKTKFVHAKYGQKRPIPKNAGKTVEFRKWTLWAADPKAQELTEGVTPASQDLAQSHVEATVKQYGAYTEVSDLLKRTSYDDVMEGSTDLLGEQIGTVVELVTRDAMLATTTAQYCGGRISRLAVTAADKITINEVRKAVRTLKKNKAPMFARNGKQHYICICGPDATYDLQSDTMWQDVSKYSNAEQIYDGELGRMFGVVFIESTESKVYKQSVLNAVNADTTTAATFVLKNDPTDAEVAYLSKGGNKIKIGSTEYTLAATESYTASTKTVKLSAAASLAADAVVYSEDAGSIDTTTKAGLDVHASLVFGRDAYGIIDVEGDGAMKTIIKGLGSSGTSDPLDQRATVGAKVEAYAVKVLENLWIIRMEHAVTI